MEIPGQTINFCSRRFYATPKRKIKRLQQLYFTNSQNLMQYNRFVFRGLAAGLFAATVFASCKKEEEAAPATNPGNNTSSTPFYHFTLTDGSYWIYQEEQMDSTGAITSTGGTDSVYVAGDTVIGANTYKKIVSVQDGGAHYLPNQPIIMQCDSAGYLVDETGAYIQHDNFTDTLSYKDFSGLIDGWYFMRHPDSTVTVPAGTFQTIDYEGHHYATDPNYPHPSPRFTHTLFANGTGKILETNYFYSQAGYMQRRLLRYHIQ